MKGDWEIYLVESYTSGDLRIEYDYRPESDCEEYGTCDTYYTFTNMDNLLMYVLTEYGEETLNQLGYGVNIYEIN